MITAEFEAVVEAALKSRGWLATDESPCLAVAHADDLLPFGWVRVSDDHATLETGLASEIADRINALPEECEYDDAWQVSGAASENSHDWPSALVSYERLEEGTPNDNPNTLVTISTNGGPRFTAGPHGHSVCAMAEAFRYGAFYETREEAIKAMGSHYERRR